MSLTWSFSGKVGAHAIAEFIWEALKVHKVFYCLLSHASLLLFSLGEKHRLESYNIIDNMSAREAKYYKQLDLLLLYSCSQASREGFCFKTHHVSNILCTH